MDVFQHQTISELKSKISDITGVPENRQLLTTAWKMLNLDHLTLAA